MLIPALAVATLLAAAAPSPEAALQSAEEAFDEASFDLALKKLDKLVSTGGDAALLSRAQLLRGRCFSAKGRPADVEKAFTRALEADPEARLDPASVAPQLVQQLDALRSRLTSQLRASADREGATVLLDGKELGPAPLKASVPIGRHTLSMRTADGKYAEQQELVFYAKRVQEVSLSLREVVVAKAPEPVAPAMPVPEEKPAAEAIAPAQGGEPASCNFVADLRAEGQPGKGLGFELGGGISGRHYAVTLHGVAGGYWGLTLRGALVFPELVAGLGAYGSLDVPLFFVPGTDSGRSGGALVGGGLAVGARYDVLPWLAPFVEVAGRYYFARPDAASGQDPWSVLLAVGVAARVP